MTREVACASCENRVLPGQACTFCGRTSPDPTLAKGRARNDLGSDNEVIRRRFIATRHLRDRLCLLISKRDAGYTCTELSILTGENRDKVVARVRELRKEGRVFKAGKRARTNGQIFKIQNVLQLR